MTSSAVLLRRSNIFLLANEFRRTLDGMSIDDIAERHGITLYRADGHEQAADGVAIIEPIRRQVAVESLAKPGSALRVWGGVSHEELRVILINCRSTVPEREIWWHEFYHILFSPRTGRRTAIEFRVSDHTYRVEERRADDFTAAMLVPSIQGLDTLEDVMARYDVSKRLARHAIRLHAALGWSQATL